MKTPSKKILAFYLPWILKQFQLPNEIEIELIDGYCPRNKVSYGEFHSGRDPKIKIYLPTLEGPLHLIETVAHELQHAHQYYVGELCFDSESNRIWKSVDKVTYTYSSTVCENHYWNLPWEIEARRVGEEISREIAKKHLSVNIFRSLRWKIFKENKSNTITVRDGRVRY